MTDSQNLAMADTAQEVADMLEITAQSFEDSATEAAGNGNKSEAKSHDKVVQILRQAAEKLSKV